ncbi:MAG: sodium:alanine symporter family protein [Oscillospiraceae bacterium]|nr:sodium:alanine symporter family protein [Oscillospiraceae bacterium]
MDFYSIIKAASDFLWDYILLILLCGSGIWFSIRTGFIQVRNFGKGMKQVFGNLSLKGETAGADGMSSFQALTTAIAAQVGTGNIAGCATAIASGGPGAIFWMWVSAFFGMSTMFGEAVLAQKYKTTIDGEVTGGPIYYIRAAFQGGFGKFLAGFFSVAIILALGFMGNMVQSNSIGTAFKTAFGVSPVIIGVIVALLAGFVFMGGVQRIASVTEKLVPLMAAFYILGCIAVLVINHNTVLLALQQIFVMAFQPQAMAGGVVGVTVKEAMRFGVARGLFSNEAGMGSTPHAHAIAKVNKPEEQGNVAMVGVFIDTFVVLTLNALVIISSGVVGTIDPATGEARTGVVMAQYAFEKAFGGFGSIFVAVCLLFFAFSTIVGWYFFGESNIKALFGKRAVKIYAALVVVFVALGSALKVDIVWLMADFFNGLMVLPNLIALLALTGTIVKISRGQDGLERLRK